MCFSWLSILRTLSSIREAWLATVFSKFSFDKRVNSNGTRLDDKAIKQSDMIDASYLKYDMNNG